VRALRAASIFVFGWLFVVVIAACSHSAAPKKTATGGGRSGVQEGMASWYGGSLHGGPTASGERFDKNAMTAAHRTLPMNTRVRVTSKRNGRSVVVRINDRGPYGKRKRLLDLSKQAARRLGMLHDGIAQIRAEVLEVGQKSR
jgi:rare lipoprotein A